jgi:CheY-like chemotaxis protein
MDHSDGSEAIFQALRRGEEVTVSIPTRLKAIDLGDGSYWLRTMSASHDSGSSLPAGNLRRFVDGIGDPPPEFYDDPMTYESDVERPLILVVDDDPDIADWIAKQLIAEHMAVVVALDGWSAWGWLSENDPDLVITNVMMPIINGYELTRRIRAKNGPPVVICSAKSLESDRQRGLALGAVDWISKPTEMEQLGERVKAALHLG